MFKFFLGLCVSALLVTESLQAAPATKKALYNSVVNGDYEAAVNISITLSGTPDHDIGGVVTKLITNKINNVMAYAYKLWQNNKDIVIDNFPEQFKLIFDVDNTTSTVIILNKEFDQALKLDATKDSYGDREAWGDNNHKLERVSWKIIPVWKDNDNEVTFKLHNIYFDMYLKLEANMASYGSRRAYGSLNANEVRHRYYFLPQFINDQLVFVIVNCDFDESLKLSTFVYSYGDRPLYGALLTYPAAGALDRDKWMFLPW